MALTVSTEALVAVSELPGRDIDAACAACGIAPTDLAAPNGRLPSATVAALWADLATRVRDPGLALRTVVRVPIHAYRAIDYVTTAAPTVGAAFRQIGECFPLINESATLSFDGCADGTWIGVHSTGPMPELYVEFILAAICTRIREGAGIDVTPAVVELVQSSRNATRDHARMFGRSLQFSAPRSRVLIPRRLWAAALPSSDPSLFGVLREHVRAQIAARSPASTGPVAATRWAIRAQLAHGHVTLSAIARRLATSTRSLQRQLSAHGACFQDLLDQVRDEVARAQLSDPERSLGQVASELGFARQSSLTRAVRRWAGAPPSVLRRKLC